MARPKKTVRIADVVDRTNAMLADSKPECSLERRGVAWLLERILMDADAYGGFSYLDGWPCEDETRRHYNTKAGVR